MAIYCICWPHGVIDVIQFLSASIKAGSTKPTRAASTSLHFLPPTSGIGMESRRAPPFPQMQRQRSSSDPYTAIPRRVVEQREDRARRGSMSSLSTLIQDLPVQPTTALAKDGGEPRMEAAELEIPSTPPQMVSLISCCLVLDTDAIATAGQIPPRKN